MRRPEEYQHILAWGKMMGSFMPFIRHQQELAAKHEAPLNAVYFQETSNPKRWVTLDECVESTQLAVDHFLNEVKNAKTK